MNLKELIERLEAVNPDHICKEGFGKPHSYRGYYEQIAFDPASNVDVASMLAHARSADGATFTGYKGGEYKMNPWTTVNIAPYGHYGGDDDLITQLRIDKMLDVTGDWIDWGDIDTDESPVPEGTIVEVQIRSGEYRCGYSEDVSWEDDLGPWTVIRYRILGSRGDL